jgi:hypothetical protein
VYAPVVAFLDTTLNPFSERTAPVKVVLAIFISLSWQMSAALCDCQGAFRLHYLFVKRKVILLA